MSRVTSEEFRRFQSLLFKFYRHYLRKAKGLLHLLVSLYRLLVVTLAPVITDLGSASQPIRNLSFSPPSFVRSPSSNIPHLTGYDALSVFLCGKGCGTCPFISTPQGSDWVRRDTRASRGRSLKIKKTLLGDGGTKQFHRRSRASSRP